MENLLQIRRNNVESVFANEKSGKAPKIWPLFCRAHIVFFIASVCLSIGGFSTKTKGEIKRRNRIDFDPMNGNEIFYLQTTHIIDKKKVENNNKSIIAIDRRS